MKLELIGHDEKYALEQSLLTLFPGEKPVYGTVDKTADTRWARVTLTEEDERVQVTTELGMDGKSAAHSYDYPLSGTEYEKEGQRRHAVGHALGGVVVAVPLGAHDADEGKARCGFAAVIDDIGHFGLHTALHKGKGDPFHQLFQFHR